MKIILHGGKCCGIKQIYGLDYNPSYIIPAKRRTRPLPNEGRVFISSKNNWYYPSAPSETLGDRLKRYVAFTKKKRPSCIIEVVLSDGQLLKWRPFIEEEGFKLVNSVKNSNSGSKIHIYHLNVGE